MSPVPRNSGLWSSGETSVAALDGARVTFRVVVGIGVGFSLLGKLIFAHDAFVAVQLALHAVLANAGLFGQQADDLKTPPRCTLLVPIG